ncbi:hypothetical protein MTR_2063s0010, partial [Medicago truncatula]
MAAGGLDYSIRNKLDTQYLRDMAQLADRVRRVERLKAEKARTHKFRREKVTYVDTNESKQEFDIAYKDFVDGEINFAELKPGPPYTCKVLRPSDGKNPVKNKMIDTLPKLTRSIDLVQRGLNEGRLGFGDKAKPQMQVDGDLLKDVDAMYTEVASCNVVEAIADAIEKLSVEAKDDIVECQMVEVSGSPKDANKITSELHFDEKEKATYPMDEEELIDFLNCCKLKNSE